MKRNLHINLQMIVFFIYICKVKVTKRQQIELIVYFDLPNKKQKPNERADREIFFICCMKNFEQGGKNCYLFIT